MMVLIILIIKIIITTVTVVKIYKKKIILCNGVNNLYLAICQVVFL